MATRAQYRSALQDKLVGLEDSGYGDFEYAESELNTYLELAVARLFPALYKRLSDDAVTLTGYGNNDYGYADTDFPERVYLVEDADEGEPIFEWQVRPTKIQKIDMGEYTTVNLYYYDAYVLEDDDDADTGISAMWTPVIVLGGLIQALESRQDSGVRGDDPPIGQLHEMPLLDRLTSSYERAVSGLAMSLPAQQV